MSAVTADGACVMTPEYLAAYNAANAADDAFHRELIRQFGARLCSDYRYQYWLHDAATKAAGIAKVQADNELARALKSMRASSGLAAPQMERLMRDTAFRIAQRLAELSKRADAIAALIRELAENGEAWEVEEIIHKLGG